MADLKRNLLTWWK